MRPSSHRCHVPLISRDPGQPFTENQASKTAIILRVGSDGQAQNLFGGVSDKQLFAGNTNAFATVCGVYLSSVCLKPRPVACKPLVLCLSLVQLSGIGHLFHNNWGLLDGHASSSAGFCRDSTMVG